MKNKGLLIIENYLPDLYKSRIPLGKFLSGEGYDVYYACPGEHEYLQLLLNNRSRFSLFETLRNVKLLYTFIKRKKIGYILSFRHHSNIYAIILYLLKRHIKVYPTVTGLGNVYDIQGKYFNKSDLLSFMYMMYAKRSTIIVQNSEIPVRLNVRNYLLINGSGVPDPFSFNEYCDDSLKFVYAGRLLRSKGVLEAGKVIEKLFRKGMSVEFKIFGDIDKENSSRLSVDELEYLRGLPFVKLYGYVENKDEIFGDSNIAILLSDYNEGLSRFLIEALSYRLAIVTVDRPGCRELAMHNNGLCISKKEEIVNFFDQPINLEALRQNSYVAFKTFYEDKHIFKCYKELLLE